MGGSKKEKPFVPKGWGAERRLARSGAIYPGAREVSFAKQWASEEEAARQESTTMELFSGLTTPNPAREDPKPEEEEGGVPQEEPQDHETGAEQSGGGHAGGGWGRAKGRFHPRMSTNKAKGGWDALDIEAMIDARTKQVLVVP